MRPAKFGQPGRQLVKQAGGIGEGTVRSARRVGHVVLRGVAKQRRASPPGVSARQPAGPRLTGPPRSDLLAAPDELPERERTRPHPGLGGDGVPEVVPGHGQHQARAGQVGGACEVAAVRADLDPVPGHHRDDFRQRRVAVSHHPGRAHGDVRAQAGQPPGEQRGRHRGPADVRRAQHKNPGPGRGGAQYVSHARIALTKDNKPHSGARLICQPWLLRHARRPGLGNSRQESTALGSFPRPGTFLAASGDFTVPAPGVDSFSRSECRTAPCGAGGFRIPVAASCHSESKSL